MRRMRGFNETGQRGHYKGEDGSARGGGVEEELHQGGQKGPGSMGKRTGRERASERRRK